MYHLSISYLQNYRMTLWQQTNVINICKINPCSEQWFGSDHVFLYEQYDNGIFILYDSTQVLIHPLCYVYNLHIPITSLNFLFL